MRWDLVRTAWRLAMEAMPGRKVYVACPLSLAQEGEFPVYDLTGGENASMYYRVVPGGASAIVSLSIGDRGAEVKLTANGRLRLRTKTSRNDVVRTAARAERVARKRTFKDYERVRVMDSMSMEYQELGQILLSKPTKKGRLYLILVDGSSDPQWFHESVVEENQAGRPPDG